MKGFVSQEFFNYIVVLATKTHLLHGVSLQHAALHLELDLESTCKDKDISAEIVTAAQMLLDFLAEQGFNGTAAAFCEQLEQCILKYNPDGTKKRRKFFTPYWPCAAEEQPDKPRRCLEQLEKVYCALVGHCIDCQCGHALPESPDET